MCGIYGCVSIRRPIDSSDCTRRTRMLGHRGPDNFGTQQRDNVFLGHTRLSILDLTAAGNQPFANDDASLVFNGEIYNWRALQQRYLVGEELRSHSDTEVLFLLLNRLGVECLPLLNGMFAFAYYKASTRTLLLTRDTTGIKPLYFVAADSHFEFSSEIKNLEYVPNLDRLKDFLVYNRIGENFVPFANVQEVLPGRYVTLNTVTGQRKDAIYGELESRVDRNAYARLLASDTLVDDLDNRLQQSIALHEQSDAPIGVLCSGGLDSSLIAAVVAKRDQGVALYHADFEGEGRETHFAQQVARHVGAELRTSHIDKGQFWEMFPEVTYALDLPVAQPHSVSLALIARKAREDGLKVLLSGEGADELFGGYWWYRHYQNSLSRLSSRWRPSRFVAGAVRRFLARTEGPDPYLYFKYGPSDFQEHAHVGFGFATWSLDEPIKALSFVGQGFQSWCRWRQAVASYDWMPNRRDARVQSFMLLNARFLMQQLLQRLDRMLMLHSIEGRVPFLEHDLFDFALNLPLDQKLRGSQTKRLLKQVALRHLPASVVNRPKVGFSVPFVAYSTKMPKLLENGFVAEWTRLTAADLRAWCGEQTGLLYKLIALEVWGRIFVHGERWQDVRVEF